MPGIWKDLRYAFRALIHSPGVTLVALFALTLGIGANTAIFSVVNSVLLRPLPYPQPNRLVILWENQLNKGVYAYPASPPNYKDWTEQSRSFDQMAAFREQPSVLTGGALPERIDAAVVTPQAFGLLGARTLRGRTFLLDEDQPGRNHVVILSYGLWQRRFGEDRNILGRRLLVDGGSYQVIGVTQPRFRLLETPSELWIPYTLDAKELKERGFHTLRVIARLKPGVTLNQARQEMQSVAAHLQRQYPDINAGWSVNPVLLRDQLEGDLRPTLYALSAAVAFVLLIACSNVANLLLLRAGARQKETAVRSALGASRFQIVRQMLAESLLLSLFGALLGLGFAYAGLRLLIRFTPANLTSTGDLSIDWRVLLFTLTVSIFAAMLFGAGPAFASAGSDLNDILKAAGRTSMISVRTRRIRGLLVISQIALSVALLIGAGLMLRSLFLLGSVDPGFRPDHVITMKLALPQTRYDGLAIARFYQRLLDRIQPLPGVRYAAVSRNVPLGGGDNSLNFMIENRPATASGDQPRARYRSVSADYFSALGIPLRKGRSFLPSDSDNSPSVVIINDVMAKQYWPSEDPLGKRMRAGFDESSWSTIVGIVGSVHYAGLDSETKPEMYYPYLQVPPTLMSFVQSSMAVIVRTAGDPSAIVHTIREQVHSLDSDQPIFQVRTMQELVSGSVAQPRFRALLLGVFALIALLLAVIGLYGVISFSVHQRSNEMGIRAALGASKRDLLILVLGEGGRLALAGVALGVLLASGISRGLTNFLYGIRPLDPSIFVAVPLLLLVWP